MFDALYLEELKVSEIQTRPVERLDEARQGLQEFVQFVDHVVKDDQQPVNDESVTVELQPSGVKGIVCRHRDESKHFRNFVGFARRPGVRSGFELLSNKEKRTLLAETRLRANSGARSFTAMLAGREATILSAARNRLDTRLINCNSRKDRFEATYNFGLVTARLPAAESIFLPSRFLLFSADMSPGQKTS